MTRACLFCGRPLGRNHKLKYCSERHARRERKAIKRLRDTSPAEVRAGD